VVLAVIQEYRDWLQKGHKRLPTHAADVVSFSVSLNTAVGKQEGQRYLQQPENRQTCADVAQWLVSQALELVQPGGVVLPMQDLCALASALPGLQVAQGSHDSVLPLAHAIAEHAADRTQQRDAPPIVRSWCDLLYGLTKAGLVMKTDLSASPGTVKQHSNGLQYLLQKGAQQLPRLLERDGGLPQDVSLILLAFAYAGFTGDLGPVIQALASNLEGCLRNAIPQDCSNIVWSLGKLCRTWQDVHQQPAGAYNREVFSYLIKQLGRHVQASNPQLTSQDVSNIVYGCALAGHVEGVPQLLDSVCQRPGVLRRAEPQHWANLAWAVGTLLDLAVEQGDQQLAKGFKGYGHKLLAACASTPGALRGAIPQHFSNLLWAASVLGWYDRRFFSDTAAAFLQSMSGRRDVMSKELSSMLLACAVCGHWDSYVHQLLVSVPQGHLPGLSEQHLANTLYAWAVPACIAREAGAGQQQLQELGQVAGALFKEAGRRWAQNLSGTTEDGLRQLFQAHMYAMHLGLPQRLEGELLKQAKKAWCARGQTISDRQKEVNSVLRQMGYKTQLQATSADGLLTIDIIITALPNGIPCSIAVEFDGPHHFVREHSGNGTAADRLNGPTRLRNVLLRARFPDGLLCIPWEEWVAATKAGRQQEYLSKALAHVMNQMVGATTSTSNEGEPPGWP
jgi:hypothetical protein